MGWRDYPALFRHMVVAVHAKSTGGGPDGVKKAMLISRDQLGKWGYLYHRGGNEVLEGIHLTGKGWVRNQLHITEGRSGDAKDLQFAALFKQIEPQLYELDGPGGKKAPKDIDDQAGKEGAENADIDVDDRPQPLYPPLK